jgi:hypothetical protein
VPSGVIQYSLSLLRAHGVVILSSPSTINDEPSEQKTSGGIKKICGYDYDFAQ